MGARPLLLLAVLLGGLLALKGLGLAEGVAELINERAYAQQSEAPDEQDAGDDAAPGAGTPSPDDQPANGEAAAPAPPDPREAARRELPTASRLGLERSLAERRRDLDRREEALDTREQLIVVAEQRVDARIARLRTLRDEIQGLLGELDDNRESQIASIVATYGQLEPDAAAGIMTAMRGSDPETLLLVADRLQRESPRRFAAVMAELRPDIAAALTSDLRARAENAEARVQAEAEFADAEG